MIRVLLFQVQDCQRGVSAAAIDAGLAEPVLPLASIVSMRAEQPNGADQRSP